MAEEEHGCQPPGLCTNNCGFFGTPATQNLCSKCYSHLQSKDQQPSSAKLAFNHTSIQSNSPSVDTKEEDEEETRRTAVKNRCMTCRRRVGLTGFSCRCGSVFCGTHRYPEQHHCTVDFKEMGKEQIAKANPVVKAQKLHKI